MKKKEIFWGMLFILAAVFIIMNQFGFLAGVSIFEIVLTVILGGIIIKSIMHLNFWGILFPLAFLCIIYADELNITKFTPWPALLTALLLSIGLSMIFQKQCCHMHHFHHNHHEANFSSNVINEQDDNIVNCSANFGECLKYVNSDHFERANVSCSFGEVKVYFDNAQIANGKADIYLDVSFGNAELYIPRNWKVINDAHAFLGNIDEKNRNNNTDAPVVTIHGSISFGNAEIIYV